VKAKWNKRFLELAKHISTWSKDPSTQIGCVIVDENRRILSVGYNGLPDKIEDREEIINNRELKYKYVIHAEMNALYNALKNGVSVNGSIAYVYGLPICSECAKAIVQTGVKAVVFYNTSQEHKKWQESWNLSKEFFIQANIEYREYKNL